MVVYLGNMMSLVKERVIYYSGKKFTNYKSTYTMVEKLCCVFVWATKQL